jgi:hypothetical protein
MRRSERGDKGLCHEMATQNSQGFFSPGSGAKRTDLKVSADGPDRPTLRTVLY